jgi:clan AA aspartic protease (TIGR02281 family)
MAQIAEWPVRVSQNNKLLIDGAINGHKVGVALDTGATFTVITHSEALRLGLKPSSTKGLRIGGVGGVTDVGHVLVDEIRIGETTRKDWNLLVAGEEDFGREFSVLLGDDFLRSVDIEFDLPDNAVRLYRSNGCGGAALAYWTASAGEAAIEPYRERQPSTFLTVRINGLPIRALLDSGAQNSLLSKSVAARLGAAPGMRGVVAAGRVRGVGKNQVDAWVGQFQSFAIGNEVLKEIAILFADLPADVPMLLGSDFLRAHRVLVAHSQGKIYFTYIRGPAFQLGRYDAALWMNPRNAGAFLSRGNVSYRNKDYDQAIADYDDAVRINPQLAEAFVGRGNAWRAKGDIDRAVADYDAAVRADPKLADAYNHLAWELATSQRPAIRDGRRAVELALEACELTGWKNPDYIDTLAAAYARAGDFQAAVKWQRKAMENLEVVPGPGADNPAQRLRQYQDGKAWPAD